MNLRSEKPDRVIAPVVGEPTINKVFVADEVMDRQQFDGRNTYMLQVLDHCRRRESAIGAAQVLRDVRVSGCKSVHMQFIDHRPVPRGSQQLVSAPGEGLVDNHAFGYRAGVILVVEGEILFGVTDLVPIQRIGPSDRSCNRLRIGIEQELGRVESVPLLRLIRPMDAVAITLSGTYLRQVYMPDVIGTFLDSNPVSFLIGVRFVKQTQLHRRGIFRKQREVHSLAVPRCS